MLADWTMETSLNFVITVQERLVVFCNYSGGVYRLKKLSYFVYLSIRHRMYFLVENIAV